MQLKVLDCNTLLVVGTPKYTRPVVILTDHYVHTHSGVLDALICLVKPAAAFSGSETRYIPIPKCVTCGEEIVFDTTKACITDDWGLTIPLVCPCSKGALILRWSK